MPAASKLTGNSKTSVNEQFTPTIFLCMTKIWEPIYEVELFPSTLPLVTTWKFSSLVLLWEMPDTWSQNLQLPLLQTDVIFLWNPVCWPVPSLLSLSSTRHQGVKLKPLIDHTATSLLSLKQPLRNCVSFWSKMGWCSAGSFPLPWKAAGLLCLLFSDGQTDIFLCEVSFTYLSLFCICSRSFSLD